MAFKLTKIPGFADLPDRVLEAEQPALGMLISRISGNASFGMVRPEVFVGRYKDGETVNLPVSDVDGYTYQRSELMYVWGIYSTVNPGTGMDLRTWRALVRSVEGRPGDGRGFNRRVLPQVGRQAPGQLGGFAGWRPAGLHDRAAAS
jgi:hypothetical protein